MKTSLFNGINTGQIEFNYNIRYRPRVNITELGMKRQIEYLFNGINYEHIYYVWENDKYSTHKHAHSLVYTNDENLIVKLQENIISKKTPFTENRKIPIQRERCLINPTNGEKTYFRQEYWEEVTSTKINGKYGELYVEPILSTKSSSIYINKFTDHGANFGYIVQSNKD
jgi:hypothetical protein